MDYEQTYIDTLWCELEIYPNDITGDFLIHPNYLHIWPKQTFMFIAIPSPVSSNYDANFSYLSSSLLLI